MCFFMHNSWDIHVYIYFIMPAVFVYAINVNYNGIYNNYIKIYILYCSSRQPHFKNVSFLINLIICTPPVVALASPIFSQQLHHGCHWMNTQTVRCYVQNNLMKQWAIKWDNSIHMVVFVSISMQTVINYIGKVNVLRSSGISWKSGALIARYSHKEEQIS